MIGQTISFSSPLDEYIHIQQERGTCATHRDISKDCKRSGIVIGKIVCRLRRRNLRNVGCRICWILLNLSICDHLHLHNSSTAEKLKRINDLKEAFRRSSGKFPFLRSSLFSNQSLSRVRDKCIQSEPGIRPRSKDDGRIVFSGLVCLRILCCYEPVYISNKHTLKK